MANGASRIDSTGAGMASIVLPPIPFVPTPTTNRVVLAADLAEWNKQHRQAMQEWLEKLNTVLQRTG